MAVNEALRFAFASLCFDRAWNLMKFGIAIAARMPMIATTIINSMSVKPFCSFFMDLSLWDGTSGVLESKARAGRENRGFPRDCAADPVTMESKNVAAVTRRVTPAFAGRLDRTSAHPQTAGEGRPSGAAPREVRRPDETGYTSL